MIFASLERARNAPSCWSGAGATAPDAIRSLGQLSQRDQKFKAVALSSVPQHPN